MKKIFLFFITLLLFLVPITSQAHKIDQSLIYLRIYEELGIEGRFEIHVNELKEQFGIDFGLHPKTEKIAPYAKEIQEYLLKHSAFSSELGEHKIIFTGEISELWLGSGNFVNFHFKLENTDIIPENLTITYSAFIDENPNHTNLLGMEYNWKAGLINNEAIISLFFTKGDTTQTLELTDRSVWKGFIGMIKQGIWHIWIGLDHILFLLALILPSVVRRRKVAIANSVSEKPKFDIWGWEPVLAFKPAFIYILKIVTFFTIAHTITLSLASFNIISLPSRVVESIIALSIGLAAYHNIRPIFKGRDWLIAFGFGLFHGFGFASVMADLGFNGEFLSLTILGFNLGVELGQVVIIMAIFPILFFMRKLKFYPKFLVWLSVVLIVISLYWFIERAFDINIRLDDYIIRKLYNIAVYLGLK
ncbi:HupE/UreJ family protein [Kriegella aquimaris]|uniref:HupE / UreJ protein n=1 Tax=Kriegella aquimaris TaxID=192904 RepID=A0A1G9IRE8_9FLAO|nr:HupE/UreJ family protein [Kriegella aquimaris]SDL27596.1 HupE / UreJ protein [Kriegella aquimaris]